MAKRKQAVSKHDLIRAIKDMDSRIMYLDSMLASLGNMFRLYVDFMGNEAEYMKYVELKEELDTDGDDTEHKRS